MIDKKISISEDVAQLTTEAQLLFTWMIPHCDDAGLLPFSTRSIKALVVPMKDWTLEDIGFQLESIQKVGIIEVFEWEKDKFWHVTNFAQHQTLKRDRQPQTILKIRLSESASQSWNTLSSIWKPFGAGIKEVSKEEKEVIGETSLKLETGRRELLDKYRPEFIKKPER